MIETELNKVLNYMKQYVENIYEHDSEPMLNYKDLQLVLDEIERLNKRNEILSKELTKDSPINQSKLSTCCGIPIEEIPELVNKVEILQRENTRLGKTAYRKGRIIDEIEKYLKEFTPMAEFGTNRTYIPNDIVLDKLKELKEIYVDE